MKLFIRILFFYLLSTAVSYSSVAQDAASGDSAEADRIKEDLNPDKQTEQQSGFSAKDLFVGVGIGLTHNLSGSRASDFKVAELDSGDSFVQVQQSEDTDIRVLFETHYLLKDQSVFDGDFPNRLSSLAACGPFAFVSGGDVNRRGCGPFLVAAIESDAEVSEFGLGWFIGFGKDDAAKSSNTRDTGFGLGIGLMIDPDAETIDGRVVDRSNYLIKDDFVQAYNDGEISLSTKETAVSFLLMVSRDF